MALHPWDDADAQFEEQDFDEPAMSPPGEEAFEDCAPQLPVMRAAEPVAAEMAEEEPPIPDSPFACRRAPCELVVPSPKRRRISGKQSLPQGFAEPVAALKSGDTPSASKPPYRNLARHFCSGSFDKKFQSYVGTLVAPVPWDKWADTWQEYSHRERYRFVLNKFQYWLRALVQILLKKPPPLSPDEEFAVKVSKAVGKNSDAVRERNVLMHEYLQEKEAPAWIMDFAAAQWPPSSKQHESKFLQQRSVLLTWHGEWGIIRKLQSGEPFATALDELEAQLRKDAHVLAIWAEFSKRTEDMFSRLEASHYGTCLELCTKTWRTEETVRLHCHAFFMTFGKKMVCNSPLPLIFLGSMPNKSQCDAAGHRGKNAFCGIYYCVAPKIGNLLSSSTAVPWEHFAVNPDWVFGLLELGKISYENVRATISRSPKNLLARLGNLEKWYEEKMVMERNLRIAARQAELTRKQLPFKTLAKVDAFLRKFLGPIPCERKKILVLTGPSGMGKTQYVRSLFPPGGLLELNAANMAVPCLPGFDERLHRAIFWDECPAVLVSDNRKLFQHTATLMDLGHSPTGQHIQRYWLNDAVSIIATNRWEEDVAAMNSPSDEDWLRANTVVIRVMTPLYR